jgi:hypothetical protein
MAQETLVSGTTTAIDSSSNLVTNISGITLEIDKASRAISSGWGFQEQNISVCRLCTDANKSIKG